MCGRYVLSGTPSSLSAYFGLQDCPDFLPRYNIAPQSEIPVIRQRPEIGLVGQIVRWGLVPSWAKDPSIGAKLNNARAESVADKPSFRSSFTRHRCIIPASGYFEWQAVTRNGKALKQPWYIRPDQGNAYFAMAGLLAKWVAPDGSNLITACVITTEPNGVMTPIHDRMPVILSGNDIGTWLDPGNHDRGVLTAMLKPVADESMKAVPVSLSVNRAGNEGPELIQAIELSE
jgi:putative SOS response-associated peptidase YedK